MKKYSFLLMLMVVCVSLANCQKKSSGGSTGTTDTGGGGTTNESGTDKNLFSLWTVSNSAWSIDLTAGNVNGTAFATIITMSDGVTQCTCSMSLTGTQTSGTCAVNGSCSFTAGLNDPGCASNSGNGFSLCGSLGTYSKTNTSFTFGGGASYN